MSPPRLRNIAVQDLRYTQTEAGLLPAWRILSELRALAEMRAERIGPAPDDTCSEIDGWEGIE